MLLCRANCLASCKVLPPSKDKVTAVCLKLWAVNLLLFSPASFKRSFTIPLIVLVVNRFPLLLLLVLLNNGALSVAPVRVAK